MSDDRLQRLLDLPPASLAAQDYASQQDLGDLAAFLRAGVDASGYSLETLNRDIFMAVRSAGKISAREYFRYRMYKHDPEERRRFLSDRVHWKVHDLCNDAGVAAQVDDKLLAARLLEEAGHPTIPILAVLNPEDDDTFGAVSVQNADALQDFLAAAEFPLFAKPQDLLGSFGAMRIEGLDAEVVHTNAGSVAIEDVLDIWLGGLPYVVQPFVRNHSALSDLADGLATIRTFNLVEGDDVQTPWVVLKLPAAGHVADNFWREGNLVAAVDPDSGVLERIVRGVGPHQEVLERHPDSGAQLRGVQLPLWDEVVELNRACARSFGALTYQSLDIAVTDDGPLVVELNGGGSFDPAQVASGRGFLTPEIDQFLQRRGADLGSWTPEEFGLDSFQPVDLRPHLG